MLLLFALSASAHAVAFEPAYALTPYAQPTWFNPQEAGSGFLFGILPNSNDLLFGAYYTYTQSGATDWVILQGAYTANSDLQRFQTGVLGKASATLLTAQGGPCLTCGYVAPTTNASAYGTGEFVLLDTTRAEFRVGGGTKVLVPLDLAALKPVVAILPGRWVGTRRSQQTLSVPPAEDACTIVISARTNPTGSESFTRATSDVRKIPAPNSSYFRAAPQQAFCFADDPDLIVVDPTTSEMHQFFVPSAPGGTGNVISAEFGIADIFLTAPNHLVVRRYLKNTTTSADVVIEYQFTKASN